MKWLKLSLGWFKGFFTGKGYIWQGENHGQTGDVPNTTNPVKRPHQETEPKTAASAALVASEEAAKRSEENMFWEKGG